MKKEIKIEKLPDLKKAREKKEHIEYFEYLVKPSEFLLNFFDGKKYYIRTYGCQANMRDSETLAGLLECLKMNKTEVVDDADLIILNTCCVRENAEDKVFGEIGALKALKNKNPNLLIVVCGCMVEQTHIVNKLLDT